MKKKFKLSVQVCAAMLLAVGLVHEAPKARLFRSLKNCPVVFAPNTVHAQGVTVLWSADMESNASPGPDLGQWYSPACCNANNAGGGLYSSGAASGGPSFDYNHTTGGQYSAMLKIGATSGTPTNGARLFRWMEPQTNADLYYRTWYYFPQTYTPNGNPAFWNVFQWKSNGTVEGNNPFFILNVGNRAPTDPNPGAMFFYLYDQYTQTSYAPLSYINIPVGGWTHVEAHYVCAGNTTGHVTFWEDGTEIFDVSGVQTRYVDGDCQWIVNNYSNSLATNPPSSYATIYVDDAAICSGGRCP